MDEAAAGDVEEGLMEHDAGAAAGPDEPRMDHGRQGMDEGGAGDAEEGLVKLPGDAAAVGTDEPPIDLMALNLAPVALSQPGSLLSDDEPPPLPPQLECQPSSSERAQAITTTALDLIKQHSAELVQYPTSTFFCGICLDNCRSTQGYHATGRGGCSHMFCRECLVGYLMASIDVANVAPVCPIPRDQVKGGCDAFFCDTDVRALITDMSTLAKYTRFKTLAETPQARECPHCATVCSPKFNLFGRVQAAMVCDSCQGTFCFYHSNAHPNESCTAYLRRMRHGDKHSRELIDCTSKKCPSCGSATTKSSGCNHMTCASCGADWCWLCNQRIRSVDKHYDPISGSCPGSQFSQSDGTFLMLDRGSAVVWLIIVFLFTLIFTLVWGFTLLGVLPATGCCCCFCCSLNNKSKREEDMFYAWLLAAPPIGMSWIIVTLIWALFAIAWTALMSLLLALSVPIWACLLYQGKVRCRTLRSLWLWCPNYFVGTTPMQMILNPSENDHLLEVADEALDDGLDSDWFLCPRLVRICRRRWLCDL